MLWKILARWAVAAIAVPVVVAVARRISRNMEATHGSTRTSVLLTRFADGVDRLFGRAQHRQVAS
jgi:hypothetical protein